MENFINITFKNFSKLVQYNFGKPIVPNQSSKVNYNHIKNTFINEK